MTVGITGIGAVTAAGTGREATWKALLAGETAIGEVSAWDCSRYPVRLAGQARQFDPADMLGSRRARRLDRCHQLLLAAALEAVADAGLDEDPPRPERVAIVIGTSLAGTHTAQRYARARAVGGRARGRDLLSYPAHVCLDVLTRELGFTGPRTVFSTACTASAVALAYATELLATGQADLALTGGVDPLTEFSFAGFSAMKNVSPAPCAPFSTPPGLTVGEGAALLVLEPGDRAARRGARVYAGLAGYGLTADAYHPTSPDPSARAQVAAAQAALDMAGIGPRDLGYVSAHGTGTAGNDEVESRAITMLLGDRAAEVPVSSLKGALGHTLGAAGAVEAAMTALALHRGVLPPTANFRERRPRCDLDYVPRSARDRRVPYALSLNFAFGGNNAALVLAAPDRPRAPRRVPSPPRPRRVVITGMGIISPVGCGAGELTDTLAGDRSGIGPVSRFDTSGLGAATAGVVEDFRPGRFTRAAMRRVDRIGQLTVCAADLALRDSGWQRGDNGRPPGDPARAGMVVGTMLGPAASCERFFAPVAAGRVQAANPAIFPNSVVNAGPGLAATALRLRACNLALTSGQASGLNALCVAADLIRAGAADLVLAGGADELEPCHLRGWAAVRQIAPYVGVTGAPAVCAGAAGGERSAPFELGRSGMVLGEGAVLLALESRDSALARGARIYGEVLGHHANADIPVTRGWDPSGRGLARCMKGALAAAGLTADRIGVVGAAAMSHPLHDLVESRAVCDVFAGARVPVTALSSRVGVCAATAPLTVCAVLLGMAAGRIPGGVSRQRPDPACEVDVADGPWRPGDVRAALVNASSLGGGNYSLVVGRA